jgi:outer membrane cobalamin receptor
MKKALISVMMLLFAGTAGPAGAQQADVKLNEVVVTATKTEKDPKDVTQSVTVITAEEIRKSGATNAGEAVRGVVGVTLKDNGPRGANNTVNVRGANYSQVLVLLDGARLNSSQNGGFDLAMLPVSIDDIERIEIVRGPGSPLYGADAVGGVVNIITKKPAGPVSVIGGAIGSHGYDSLQLSNSGRQGSGYYSVTGTRETSDGYRQNSDLDQWIVNGKVGFDVSKTGSLEVAANYLSREIGVPGTIQFASPFARQQDRNQLFGANYRQRFGKQVDMLISASEAREHQRYKNPDPAFSIESLHETTSRRGEGKLSWLAGPWSLVTLGYEVRKDDIDSTTSGVHSATADAWYVQDEISLGDALIVVVGDRHDEHSVFGGQHSPRASARYRFAGTGTILRGSAGKSFRAPTFNDLYYNDGFFSGNPNLRPETAKEYEAGIEQPLGAGNSMKVTGFERKVKDLISWSSGLSPVNIDQADIKGIEAEVVARPSNDTVLSLNYTYIKPIDETTGQLITYTIPKKQLKGSITIAVDADVYITADGRAVENYVNPGAPQWRYSVYDAKIAQKIGKKGVRAGEIYFAMTNIFGRKYDSLKDPDFGDYPGAPKEIRGGISYPF